MKRATVLSFLVVLGCQHTGTQNAPAPAPAGSGPTANQGSERPWVLAKQNAAEFAAVDDEPLGADVGLAPDQEPLPDTAIDRLLTVHVTLPPRITLAALYLPGIHARRPWFMSQETNDMTQLLADSMIAVLSRSGRVGRVAVLPSVLIGDQRTVRALRESAARIQADGLFLFRPNCRLYERYPFMGHTQYRAVCTIEAVVLHTRSGVIPFSTVISRESITQKHKEDFDVSATWARVQLDAVALGLIEVSQRVGSFLETVPQQDQP